MTQEELAEAVDITRTYLSLIECGHRNIRISLLVDIAAALGTHGVYQPFALPAAGEPFTVYLLAYSAVGRVAFDIFPEPLRYPVLVEVFEQTSQAGLLSGHHLLLADFFFTAV